MAKNSTLAALRVKAGYTQQEVAEILGVSFATYQRYEYGDGNIPSPNAIKLANLFDVSTDCILQRVDPDIELEEEKQLIAQYRLLDDPEQEQVLAYCAELVELTFYRKNVKL